MGFDILQYSTSVGCDTCAGGVNRDGTGGGENDGGGGGAAGNIDGGGAENPDGEKPKNALAVGANPILTTTVEAIAVNNFFIGFLWVFTKSKVDKL
ncbi:hypothetical protein AFK68_02785 [Hydrocoleum sp. CS-953]|nr:hypothetical protein AFK68_02785 [Hydrocoleum sp. CS-953]